MFSCLLAFCGYGITSFGFVVGGLEFGWISGIWMVVWAGEAVAVFLVSWCELGWGVCCVVIWLAFGVGGCFAFCGFVV